MGAIISVDTDRTIRIEGVAKLTGYRHTALPDRIEAASWGAAAWPPTVTSTCVVPISPT